MREASSPRPRRLDPTSSLFRWSILLAAGLMLSGCYFAINSISAVSQLLIEQEGYTATQIGLMESLYSWPSILGTALLAGILVDRLGTRVMSLLCAAVVVLGAVTVAMAPGFVWILVGRAILGAGAEALAICQTVIVSRWFKGKELALAFGMTLVLVRLGSFASHNLETAVAHRYGGVGAALWFAALMCVGSLMFAVYYAVMDKLAHARSSREEDEEDKDKDKAGQEAGQEEQEVEQPSLRERIVQLDRRYWYILGLATALYGAIFPFRALAQDFFHSKWGIAPETGGHIVSVYIFVSMLAPAVGWFVDRQGRRASLILLGACLVVPAHLSMGLWELHPIYPMVMLGLALALVAAAVWPSVALVVEPQVIGTAYGLIFLVQNLALALFPVLNGALRDATHGYAASQLMFAGLGLLGVAFALLLLRADASRGRVLETQTKPR